MSQLWWVLLFAVVIGAIAGLSWLFDVAKRRRLRDEQALANDLSAWKRWSM